MANRRRVNWVSQKRGDAPDFRSIESAVSNDFDELLSTMLMGPSATYVVRGFEILMTGAIGGSASGLQLLVDNAAVLHGSSNESGTVFVVPVGTSPVTLNSASEDQVDGSFTPSAPNYVYLEFEREVDDSTIGPVAVWNPTNRNEITKNLPLASTLDFKVYVSTVQPTSNYLPIAKVVTDASNNVTSIEDRRPLLCRLGSAGFSDPDPFYEFEWDLHTEGRAENPTTSSSSYVNPFRGGDKQLDHLKRWMDAVMSIFKELKGTPFWYEASAGGSIFNLRADTANTVFTGRGAVSHDESTPGLVNWSEDVFLRFIGGRHYYKIESNPSGADVSLGNDQAAYIKLVRGEPITPYLVWVNAGTTVTSVGSVPWTSDLEPGDFIKKASDNATQYFRIDSITNGYTVELSSAFDGTSTGSVGAASEYAFGVYRTSAAPSTDRHVRVADRKDVPFSEDHFWLFLRDDNEGATQEVQRVTATADVSGDHDGDLFLLYDTYRLAQYLIYLVVGGSGTTKSMDGHTAVPVAVATNATADDIATAIATEINALSGFSSSPVGGGSGEFTVSNDKTGFAPDMVDGQGDDATGFTFAHDTQGEAARVYARFIGSEIEQGEVRLISDNAEHAHFTYTGSKGEFDTKPAYNVTATGAVLRSSNYNSTVNENLTQRLSKVTSMMADRAQDKTVTMRSDFNEVVNTTNATNQDVTFLGGSGQLVITLPSVSSVGTIGLTGTLSLSANQAAYFQVDRNKNFTLADLSALTVSSVSDVPLGENVFIFALRGSTTEVVLWDGFRAPVGTTPSLVALNAELRRFLRRLELRTLDSDPKRVQIVGPQETLLDGSSVTQSVANFMITSVFGAQIDPVTGNVFKADGVTPLGENFTPPTVAASQYRWLGVSLIPGDLESDDTMYPKVSVTVGTSDGATPAAANKPTLSGKLPIGWFYVQRNAGDTDVEDVAEANIYNVPIAGGAGGDQVTSTYMDPVSVSLPTGATVTIDGQTGVDGDTVLYTNLSSGNNRVYKLGGVGSSITWTPQSIFGTGFDPEDGETVRVLKGDAFADQLAVFDGSDFKVNETVRFFTGGDFWELSAIKRAAIANNTTDSIFEVTALGSENIVVNYSILRGTDKETGVLIISQDGTNVNVTRNTSEISSVGVDLFADISAGDLRLRYTSDSSGATGVMSYYVSRWSDASGGPTGIPSYSPSGLPSSVLAAGNIEEIQFHGSGGVLDADSNFKWDNSDKSIKMNGMYHEGMRSSLTLNDNQTSPLMILQFPHASFRHFILEYSVERGGESRTGRMMITTNGTAVGFDDSFVETTPLGVVFSATISGANLEIQYTTTSTGSTASFKHATRKWL